MLRRLLLISLLICCALLFSSGGAWAGKLGDFEADATKTSDNKHDHDHDKDSSRHHDDDDDNSYRWIWKGIAEGGSNSIYRICPSGPPNAGLAPRLLGDPLLPFVRVDSGYRHIDAGVNAIDTRLEAGYGPVGFHYSESRYLAPGEKMDLQEYFGLYRMSADSHVEVDFGAGGMTLIGNDHTNMLAVTMPIHIEATPHLAIEFRPACSDTIQDYDLGALVTLHAVSLTAGYRWVNSPHDTLDGPYAGLSVRY